MTTPKMFDDDATKTFLSTHQMFETNHRTRQNKEGNMNDINGIQISLIWQYWRILTFDIDPSIVNFFSCKQISTLSSFHTRRNMKFLTDSMMSIWGTSKIFESTQQLALNKNISVNFRVVARGTQ